MNCMQAFHLQQQEELLQIIKWNGTLSAVPGGIDGTVTHFPFLIMNYMWEEIF